LAFVDVSTGHLRVAEAESVEALEELLKRVAPTELIVPSTLFDAPVLAREGWFRLVQQTAAILGTRIVRRPFAAVSRAELGARLLEMLAAGSADSAAAVLAQKLEGLSPVGLSSVLAAIGYVEEVSFTARPALSDFSLEHAAAQASEQRAKQEREAEQIAQQRAETERNAAQASAQRAGADREAAQAAGERAAAEHALLQASRERAEADEDAARAARERASAEDEARRLTNERAASEESAARALQERASAEEHAAERARLAAQAATELIASAKARAQAEQALALSTDRKLMAEAELSGLVPVRDTHAATASRPPAPAAGTHRKTALYAIASIAAIVIVAAFVAESHLPPGPTPAPAMPLAAKAPDPVTGMPEPKPVPGISEGPPLELRLDSGVEKLAIPIPPPPPAAEGMQK
ncbi:MAG: hypothetical protein ABI630_08950, partial [Betaproteobacteria bacterium]